MVGQNIPEDRAVFRPGVGEQVVAVHQPQCFFLCAALHQGNEGRCGIHGGKAVVIILHVQAGNIIDPVYDLHEILVGFIIFGKLCSRHFMIHYFGLPS